VALAAYSMVYSALATTGLVLLRRSLADESLASAISNPAFVVGGLFYAASFGTFLLALRRFEVLTVYPVFNGLAYATVTMAAVGFLGEQLTTVRLGGIVLVASGVVLLAR
jgi:multidrug transporter EmrE-like cation transporter